MKITRLSTHHLQLTQLGLVNAYLVQQDDGLTLIDTAYSQAKPIHAAITALRQPLQRITLTHAHNDHAGSVDALLALHPAGEFSAGTRESRFLAGDNSLDPNETPRRLSGGFTKTTTRPSRLLNADDHLGSLRVLNTPGHSPGHIAFLDERDGTLFAGDTFINVGGLAVTSELRLIFPFAAIATWSRELVLASAESLLALKPTRLCLGHGAVITDPVPQMQQAIIRARRKVK